MRRALLLLALVAAPAHAGGGALAVSLGGAPLTSGQAAPLDFGVPLGRTSTVVLTLTNTGTAPLALLDVVVDGAGFAVRGRPESTLAAGIRAELALTFTATHAASTTSTGTLTLTTDDPVQPVFTLALLGRASDDADGDRVLAADDCDDHDPAVGRAIPWHRDDDGDGYGDPADAVVTCGGPPEGFVRDRTDNCPGAHNPLQNDTDGDGAGDRCDEDDDDDGHLDRADLCPVHADADQADLDGDGRGDACDEDVDGDGSDGAFDCEDRDPHRTSWRVLFADADGDGAGEDGTDVRICSSWSEEPHGLAREGGDNCPTVANPTQEDRDEDGVGSACDDDEPPPPPPVPCAAIGCDGDRFGCGCDGARASSAPGSALMWLLAAAVGLGWRRR